MKKYILVFISLGIFSFTTQTDPLNVITTLNYLRYVTEQVGGNKVSVRALANPRQDPHYVTPTPSMNELANDADLFIENGINLDLWAKNVIDASGNPRIQQGTRGHLIATVNVPVRELPLEISRAWGDIHPQGNPHVWLDPLNVRIIAENIADRLKVLDPGNAPYYQSRLAEFTTRLDVALYGEELLKTIGDGAGDILARKTRNNELVRWLTSRDLFSQLGGWMKKARPVDGVKVVTYHKTYIYFAERFGLVLAEELEEKPGIPPPPKHRDAVVDLVNREGIKVILNDNFYSRDAADYVASRTRATVLVSYIEVGASEETSTYEKLITYLIERIALVAS